VAGEDAVLLAERVSDSETGDSASSLARESGSEAPAWPAKRTPASNSVHSVIFDSLVPTPSPFGPTFGCSSSKALAFPVVVKLASPASSLLKAPNFSPLSCVFVSFVVNFAINGRSTSTFRFVIPSQYRAFNLLLVCTEGALEKQAASNNRKKCVSNSHPGIGSKKRICPILECKEIVNGTFDPRQTQGKK
jgi:hypothetical protein